MDKRGTRRSVVTRTAAVAGAAALAACGVSASTSAPSGGATAAAKGHVVVSKYPEQTKDPAWQEMFALAQQKTGVTVELVTEPSDGYFDKRLAELASGVANADIMVNQPNWVLSGGLQGLFADHAGYFQRDKIDANQYLKADLNSWMWKGKLWGMPFQLEGETVFFNRELLDAKGVKYPTKDWSWDDLLQTSLKLTDTANNRYGVLIENSGVPYTLGTLMLSFGGQTLNDQRDKALYGDDSNSLKGAEFEIDLYLKYRAAPSADAIATLPKGTRPMEGGLVAMTIGDISRHVSIRQALGADKVGFAPAPKGPGGLQRARVYGNAWSILALSKSRDAAWEVLKWTQTKEGLSGPQLRAIGWPSVKTAATSPEWLDPFKGTQILDAERVWESGGHNEFVLPEGSTAGPTANPPLQAALRGEKGVRDAMQESAAALNDLFSRRPAAWR